MITIAQLVARIRADYQQFIQGLQMAQNRLGTFARYVKSVGQNIANNMGSPWHYAYKMASGALGKITQGLRHMSNQVAESGEGFNYLAFIAAGAFASIGKSALDLGFQFIEMEDRANRAFTSLLGSAKKGKDFFNELKEFAIPTPFETPDLLVYAQRLLDLEVKAKEVIPTLKAIGDYVTFKGIKVEHMQGIMKAFTDMLTKGKVSLEELNQQLGDHGVTAMKLLAKQQGVTTKEMSRMVKEGLIPAEWAFKAIVYQMEKRAPNAMIKGAKDMSIAMAGLKDITRDTLSSLFRPVYEDVSELVTKVSEKMRILKGYIVQFSDETKRKLTYGLGILTAIAPATVAIEAMARMLRMALNPIGLVAIALGSIAFYLSQNKEALKQFTDGVKNILPLLMTIGVELMAAFTGIGQSLIPVVQAALPVLQKLFTLIAQGLHWFNSLPESVKTFILVLNLGVAAFGPLATAIETIIGLFAGLGTAMKIVFTGVYISGAYKSLGMLSKILLAIGLPIRWLMTGLAILASNFGKLLIPIRAVGLFLVRMLNPLTAIKTLFSGIGFGLGWLIQMFTIAGNAIKAFMTIAIAGGARSGLAAMFSGLRVVLAPLIAALGAVNWWIVAIVAAVAVFAAAWSKDTNNIRARTKAVMDVVMVFFRVAWKVLSIGIPEAIRATGEWFKWLWGQIVYGWNAVVNFLNGVYKWFDNFFTSMGGSISALWERFKTFFNGVIPGFKSVIDGLSKMWSDSAVGKEMAQTWQEEWTKHMAGGGWDPNKPFGDLKMPKIPTIDFSKYTLANPGKNPGNPDAEDKKSRKKKVDDYTQMLQELMKKKAVAESLMGKDSDYARIKFETELGVLKSVAAAKKAYIIDMAKETDSAEAMADANKKLLGTKRELSIAYAVASNNVASNILRAELEFNMNERVTKSHRAKTQALIDQAVANTKLINAMSIINSLQGAIQSELFTGDMRDFVQEIGGLDKLKDMPLDQLEQAMRLFADLKLVRSLRSINESVDDLRTSMKYIDSESTKAAIDFVGGILTWNKIPEVAQKSISSLVAVGKAMEDLKEMIRSGYDELFDAMNPVQTELDKTIRQLDQLAARSDSSIGLAFNTADAELLRNLTGQAPGAGNGYEGLFQSVDGTKLRAMKEELLGIKKAVDMTNAQKQIRDWGMEFNQQIQKINREALGTYDEMDQAVDDWKFQNRDAIEVIRKSFAQVGQETEFTKWLYNVESTIHAIANWTEHLENQIGVIEKIASLQNGLADLTAKSDLEAFTNSLKEFDKGSRQFKLPKGLDVMPLDDWRKMVNLSEQLKNAQGELLVTSQNIVRATAKTPYERWLADFMVLDRETGKLKIPDGFNKDLLMASYNAKATFEAFQGMNNLQADAAKQMALLKAGSGFAKEMIEFMTYDPGTGLMTLPDKWDEKFLKRIVSFRQQVEMVKSISQSLAESLFEGFRNAMKPDEDSVSAVRDLATEIRAVKRSLWTADDADKANLQDQLRELEQKYSDAKAKVDRSTKEMFTSFLTNAYSAFSDMLSRMAADILQSEIQGQFEKILTGVLKIGLKAPDIGAISTDANTLATNINTAAVQASTGAQALLAGSVQTMAVTLGQMPLVFGQVVAVQSANTAMLGASNVAISTNTGALFGLTGAVIANTAAVIANTGSGSVGSFGDLIPRAKGGPMTPFNDYLVGEKGPEIVRVGTSSRAYPTGTTPSTPGSGGDTHVHLHLNISTSSPQEFRRAMPTIISEARATAQRQWERNA